MSVRVCPHSDAQCRSGPDCPYSCATAAYDGTKRLVGEVLNEVVDIGSGSFWLNVVRPEDAAKDARIAELEEALRPFAAIEPSSFCAPDGSEREGYSIFLWSGVSPGKPEPDFTGADLAKARAALSAERSDAAEDERDKAKDEPKPPAPTQGGAGE